MWKFAAKTLVMSNIGGSTFPNVPANSVKVASDGTVVVGTDLGVFVQPQGAGSWDELAKGLPRTAVMDVELFKGSVYVATHGRGIWSARLPVK